MRKLIFTIALIFLFSTPHLSAALEDPPTSFNTAKRQLTVSLGYGEAYPGLGKTETRVRDIDFVLKYGHFLSGEIGSSWYRGRHEILVEIPYYYVVNPRSSYMIGINFLACWNFTAVSKTIVPYIFAGGGPLYTNLNLPEMGAKLNGNYQAGVGTHYFIKRDLAIDFTARYHHISNAGTADPNIPLNSTKVFVGLSRFW